MARITVCTRLDLAISSVEFTSVDQGVIDVENYVDSPSYFRLYKPAEALLVHGFINEDCTHLCFRNSLKICHELDFLVDHVIRTDRFFYVGFRVLHRYI